MAKATRKEMVNEAVKRMKKMDIIDDAIRQFKAGDVNVSWGWLGALFWADDELKAKIQEVEKQFNSVVYLVLHNNTEMGEMFAMLMVTSYKDEWELDHEDLEHNIAFAYVWNKTYDEMSEAGSVGFKKVPSGSVIRVS